MPSARRSPAHPFFAARSIPGLGNGFESQVVTGLAQKTAGGRAVQAAQQDNVGFSQFPGKAFQRIGQLLVEYSSVCILDCRPYMENNSSSGRRDLENVPAATTR
jgi:hypothetical protein